MRRCLFFVLTALISTVAHGNWIPFESGATYSSPVIDSVKMVNHDTIFTLKTPGMLAEPEVNEHGHFFRLEIPDNGWLMETGSPQVPVVRKNVIVPEGAFIELKIDVDNVATYSGFDIWPAQPSFKRSEPEPPFTLNERVYENNAFYPAEWATISNDAYLRDFRFVTIDLHPVRVNPVTGEMLAANVMTVRVIVEDGEWSYPEAVFPSFYQIYQNQFVNFGSLGIDILTPPEPMLIICHDPFIGNMAPFVEWKTNRGIDVTLISSTVTGTTSSAIYSYIQNVWNTWNPKPVYIVLVGDAPQLKPLTGIGNCASDSKFTLLQGNDKIPDAFISRLSAGTVSELTAQLDKILTYEKTPPSGLNGWLDKFSGLASNEGYSPSDEQYSQEIEARFKSHNPNATADRIYQRLGHGATQIKNAVNEGRFWLSYFGHGSGTSWVSPSFTNTNVNALANGSFTPFIMDVSCSNGYFNGSSDCFAERWMKNSGKGAVSMYSASTSTAWDQPARMAWGVTYAVTGNSSGAIPGGNYILGQMTLDGILYMYNYFGINSGTEEVMNQYVLFGDCSLMFRSDAAIAPNAVHPISVSTGPVTIPITVTFNSSPIKNAVVCLYKNGDLHVVDRTNASGMVSFDIAPVSTGEITVTVSGQNLEPRQSRISVTYAPPGTPTPQPTQTPECENTGDVNGDEKLTAIDAQLAFLIALGARTPTEKEACAADCNGDNQVTAIDAQDIFLAAIGAKTCADPL
ncbi:MAG: C25 family cysteine peptidase [bacterium]